MLNTVRLLRHKDPRFKSAPFALFLMFLHQSQPRHVSSWEDTNKMNVIGFITAYTVQYSVCLMKYILDSVCV